MNLVRAMRWWDAAAGVLEMGRVSAVARTGACAPRFLVAFAALMVCFGVACKDKTSPSPTIANPTDTSAIRAVATVGMVGDVVRAVGGRDVVVTVLLGPGTDPHLYKPTPADMRTLRDADIVFASGLKLEGKMEDVLKDLGTTKPVVFVIDGVPRERLIGASDDDAAQGKQFDPHVWFDVSLWAMTTAPVRDALAKLRPLKDPAFAANAAVFEKQLAALHEEVAAAMSAIPKERRVLVTAHDAFGYFGRAYGVEVLGVQGISTESEASLQTINQLVDTLVARKVPAIFVESSVNPKGIEGLKQGAASRGHSVVIGGELFSDAMGAAGTDDGTYIGMVRHNMRVIAAGLGGTDSHAAPTDAKPAGGGS